MRSLYNSRNLSHLSHTIALRWLRMILRFVLAASLVACLIIISRQYPKLENYNSRKALKAAEYNDYKEMYIFLLSYAMLVMSCGLYDLTYLGEHRRRPKLN